MKIERKENCQKHIDTKTDIYYSILSRKDIIKFTYEDYLTYIKEQENSKNNMVKQDTEDYEIVNQAKIHHEHDKTYRKLLSDKENAAHVINEALKLEEENKVTEEELEKYNTNFITNQFKDRQADIVYKLKNSNLFFVIEHQNKVDNAMSYRIEEYKLEIIKSAIDMKKIATKTYKIPTVIPIVIYTGKEKWKARVYFNEIEDKRFKNIDSLKYNLLDINQYKRKELLESNYFIDKVFLMEKTRNVNEFFEIAKRIIQNINKEENREYLRMILKTTVKEKIGEKKTKELLKEMEGEDVKMLENVSIMIDKEMKQARREGIKEGIKSVAIMMLQKGIRIKEIEELTGLKKEEIEKVKNRIIM